MATTTWTNDLARMQQRVRARHVRYWLCVLCLATADGLSFALADLLFRLHASLPAIVLFGNRPGNISQPIDIFTMLAILFIVIRYLSGDYARRQLFWDGTKGITIALLIISLPEFLMLLVGHGLYAVWSMVLSWIFLIIAVPMLRQSARWLLSRMGVWQIPTAMIGVSARTADVYDAVKESLSLGFDVRWLVIENTDIPVPPALLEISPIHSSDAARIAKEMRSQGCKEAIVTAEDMQSAHFAEVVQRLLEANIPVAIIPTINRLPLASVTTNYFFGRDILLLQVRSHVQHLPWRIAKRLFDIVMSIVLIVLFAPLFLVLVIAIKWSDPGPITYSQQRIGRYGVPFRCVKFRTMVQDAEARLHRWQVENPELYEEFRRTFKLRDDPRITPIGKWLRRTSLDELPQLFNVLAGEMSLVGPRPVVASELTDYYGPAAQLYVRIRPGLTGLWQVSGRSDTSYERRVFLDEWYILNWSFWYDIVIMIQTAWIVISRKGAF